ncbi:hypothetical protein AV530_010251 [Patagioenas fasciata monilis]|uniref:Uncharacterized protein n=1 Tax=Patagioenas fasciata monilis TaxID=372326 RepID=A0A1V4KCR4_PATFA|nr:hypothetical protein AV530_010251 [Patagioenas fasciata monilis]
MLNEICDSSEGCCFVLPVKRCSVAARLAELQGTDHWSLTRRGARRSRWRFCTEEYQSWRVVHLVLLWTKELLRLD